MHELSIAQSIVETVEREARDRQALNVSNVCLEIGELAGVELDALKFAWDSIVPHTILESARLEIDQVKGRARCEKCGGEFELQDYFDVCPICEGFENEVLTGKQLIIKSIEIEY